MKFILAVLAIFLICTQAQTAGGFTDQDISTIETDAGTKAALQAGETAFAQQAFSAGEIAAPELVGEKVVGVATQVVAGMNYKFTVELTDSEGKTVYATLNVFSQPWTKTLKLTSYTISDAVEF